VKDFQKIIENEADFKDTISGDHVCEHPVPVSVSCVAGRSACSSQTSWRHMFTYTPHTHTPHKHGHARTHTHANTPVICMRLGGHIHIHSRSLWQERIRNTNAVSVFSRGGTSKLERFVRVRKAHALPHFARQGGH